MSKTVHYRLFAAWAALLALLFLQGCAPSKYVVKAPGTSSLQYSGGKSLSSRNFVITDQRDEDEKIFSYGRLKAELVIGSEAIEPVEFLRKYTAAELQARGIPATFDQTPGGININLLKYNVVNHRTNAYTPFDTLTFLSADIETGKDKKRIGIFIQRGKIPVWSFDEVVEPTFNQPLELTVKELATKINALIYKQKISDQKVAEISDKIMNGKADRATYVDVYELGFGNNLKAIDTLKKLTTHKDDYTRMAAISSIGILRDARQLDFLKSIYNSSDSWQDKLAAIKAIGDLSTPAAIAFLNEAKDKLRDKNDKIDVWIKQVIDLYL